MNCLQRAASCQRNFEVKVNVQGHPTRWSMTKRMFTSCTKYLMCLDQRNSPRGKHLELNIANSANLKFCRHKLFREMLLMRKMFHHLRIQHSPSYQQTLTLPPTHALRGRQAPPAPLQSLPSKSHQSCP